jgi:hypothetical protein
MTLKKAEPRRGGRVAKISRVIDPHVIRAPPGRIVVERKQTLSPHCDQPFSELMALDPLGLSCSIFW